MLATGKQGVTRALIAQNSPWRLIKPLREKVPTYSTLFYTILQGPPVTSATSPGPGPKSSEFRQVPQYSTIFLAYSDLALGPFRPLLQAISLEMSKLPTIAASYQIWARRGTQRGSRLPRFAESAESDSNHPYLVSNKFDA